MPLATALSGADGFDVMRAEFQSAAQAAGVVRESRYEIAGRRVALRVAGDRLANELRLPFAHLSASESNEAPTDLLIEIWDQRETGVHCSAKPPAKADRPYYRIDATDDGRFVRDERNHHLAWLDRNAGHIVAAIDDVDRLYLDERARPFRRLLSVWLGDAQIQLSHCGLVAKHGRGVLFVGNQGAGKTTSSVACVTAGFDYLGDDFVGIGRGADGAFVGHSLYASCLLDRDHLRRFPDLEAPARAPHHHHEPKSVIYIADVFPHRLATRVPLHAVVLPRVVGTAGTSFRRARGAEALLALAPTGVMFLTSPGAGALDMLGDLVSEVPSYHLELGLDVTTIPSVVSELVEDAAT